MIDRRIKFRHIQCFVETCREKSLKRAAEKLYLTQPAMSKTMKDLEEILGTRLLHRSRAGVAPTRQGEVFLHFAQMSLAALQQGLDGVEQAGPGGTGRLSVGALPSVAARLMPEAAARFAELAPRAVLQISDGPHGYLLERLRLGELDLVIGRLGRPEDMQGLSFTQLYTEAVDMLVRPGHPLLDDPDPKRLAAFPVIFPPQGAAIRPLLERVLIANGVGELPNRIETVSDAFGRSYTSRSDAVWMISGGVAAHDIAEGRLKRLPFDMTMTRGPVGLMTRPGDPAPVTMAPFRLALSAALDALGLTG